MAWGSRKGAAQWYKSAPDRVHVFNVDGRFLYGWCVGLKVAEMFIDRHGGHLVHVRIKKVPRKRRPKAPRRSIWEMVADGEP